jgi:hypothetical protein
MKSSSKGIEIPSTLCMGTFRKLLSITRPSRRLEVSLLGYSETGIIYQFYNTFSGMWSQGEKMPPQDAAIFDQD